MAPDPTIMKAVEQLGYRVTVGDVAAQAGLNINLAQQGLLALASDAGGHLQVAESGEIAYLFPKNFRAVLRNKFWRLQLQEWWEKVWRVLFYLIRISFGIVLILSIVLIFVAIAIIVFSINASNNDDNSGGGRSHSSGGGGLFFFPYFWGPDIFWFFDPGYDQRYRRKRAASQKSEMNFLEGIFSFLFGDGNPNADLEERRWQEIGIVIRNSKGAVAAEQIAPYLDDIGEGEKRESEDYMLPVLSRFDGRPEVSPDGEIVYHFPELQTTAKAQELQSVPAYLRERLWRFSHASSGQLMGAIGLGAVNLVGALMLGSLLRGGIVAAKLGGLVAFVQSIYWLLLAYGIGFLAIPLIRYFWIQLKNSRVEARNQKRQQQAVALNEADSALHKKIAYAQQFAAQNVITQEDLVYTSETDLLDQEIERSDKLDDEWRRRLGSSS
ncbi:MAG TPA: hypothetical protein DCE56_38200 [Cyanobacteria bacterium UBA8553]|nr:hypothetical protein [Cyanobacteria bacterium UBA8553]